MSTEQTQVVGPDQALERLKTGNERFMTGQMKNRRDLSARRAELTEGQAPFASILCCSDSRVPPGLVFDQGLGRLFIARVAGNVVTPELLASLEYAAVHSTSRLIVVLGHECCGAVTAAVQTRAQGADAESPSLQVLLDRLFPVIDDAKSKVDTDGQPFIEFCSEQNARYNADRILKESDILRGMVEKGALKVVVAMESLGDGKVTFLDA